MRKLELAELAQWVSGRVIGPAQLLLGPQVVIDSREAGPGALFVALPGERVDGHDFVPAAVAAGAAAVLVERELPLPVAQVVVADTALALADLGRALVAEAATGGMVSIGITGSSGKTSTKDLTAQVLAAKGVTVAPVGSFNNEIGVPLTATRIDPETRFLVSELGARGEGHISWLCDVVRPQVGVVINVGHAHLGEFGSVAGIASAKGELVAALPSLGWAVLNADDAQVAAMADRTSARVAAFSSYGEPKLGVQRVWASGTAPDSRQRFGFELRASGPVAGSARVQLQVAGLHQVSNALAAASVGLCLGMSVAEVAAALDLAEARSLWRMDLSERPDGALVLNDAYNANPDSMAAALQALVGLRRPGGRLLAILGDMLELGPQAAKLHRELGEKAAAAGVDALIAIGAHASDLAAGFGPATMLAPNREIAISTAAAWLQPADVVLVKASRGLALESVAEELAALGGKG